MQGNDRLVFDDEHAHISSLGRSKWHRKLNRVTPGHPLCFHVGIKLRGKGVNNARPQPQAPLILRRPLSRVGDGELQGVPYLRAQTDFA
jgi:hypothetical protein